MNKLFNYLAILSLLLLCGCGPTPGSKGGGGTTQIQGGPRTQTSPDQDAGARAKKTPSPSLQKCSESSLSTTLPSGETEKTIMARYLAGPLFDKASGGMPVVKDVIQAGFNVCYFYAFLSSYVARHPQKIKDSITQVEDGFEITVHDTASTKPCVFISNLQLAIFRQSGRAYTKTLWPEVLTGAFVSYLRGENMQKATDKGIENTGTDLALGRSELLKGKTIDMSLTRKDPFKYFLNKTGKTRRIKPKDGTPLTADFLANANELTDFVDDCIDKGCVMYAYIAPGGAGRGLPSGLYDHHCYGVMDVDDENNFIFVRNPHGGNAARSVEYEPDGTTKIGTQVNEKFYLRASDFFNHFYTLQFSEF